MFEPEILEQLEPDLNLASTMLVLKDQILKSTTLVSKATILVFKEFILAKIHDIMNQILILPLQCSF